MKVTREHNASNMSSEEAKSDIVTAISKHNFEKASAEEMNDFLESLSLQLAKISLQAKNEFLAYLFTMAAQEASAEKERLGRPYAATAV